MTDHGHNAQRLDSPSCYESRPRLLRSAMTRAVLKRARFEASLFTRKTGAVGPRAGLIVVSLSGLTAIPVLYFRQTRAPRRR